MEFRKLGKSGLQVSAIAFGAGPIAGLMVGGTAAAQEIAVSRALELGINWFDTAATYGQGESERSLGAVLRKCADGRRFQVATEVRLQSEDLHDIAGAVRRSVQESLQRLGVERVQLLQLHNSVTEKRGDLPTSVTVEDVLGHGGIVDAFRQLQAERVVEHFGFTALGDMNSLRQLIHSGHFTAAQVPLSLLTFVSGTDQSAGSIDVDYAALASECAANGVGVIAIRVFAGGALALQEPSPYTHVTKFFTLDLYQRDRQRAERLAAVLP
ncbi:MAG TPA: aldo/keto reductase, partial [Nitrospiraceae bacterium]|nr:aldo/keto reductase [Nitrospiraceae bacterium]